MSLLRSDAVYRTATRGTQARSFPRPRPRERRRATAAPTTPPLPRAIQLEVTGSCNLRCQMCLVSYRPILNKITGSMSFETFRSIVDDLPELEQITLQGLGEPLLAPDLFKMIEYASARGIRLGFNTNGTLLTRERAERLVRAGVDWLHVSIDGATAATYESIRDGSDFEKVRRNVVGMVETKRRFAADRPHLQVVFVAMRRNLSELPALVRMVASWGIDDVRVQNLSHSFDDTGGAMEYFEIRRFTEREALWADPTEEMVAAFDAARREATRAGITLRLPRLEERARPRRVGSPGCGWPWDQAYVTHEGKVQPCCMLMGEDRAVLGDVRTARFADVWSGERYRQFREALLTGSPPDVCVGCSLYRGVF